MRIWKIEASASAVCGSDLVIFVRPIEGPTLLGFGIVHRSRHQACCTPPGAIPTSPSDLPLSRVSWRRFGVHAEPRRERGGSKPHLNNTRSVK